MPLQEYVARWAGGRIGVGASVFHFQSIAGPTAATTIATSTRTLFNTLVAAFPNDVSISFDSEVRELQDDGTLMAVYPVAVPSTVTGTSTASWTNGTGLMVRHSTGAIINGRRLLGRTFFVPVSGASFDTNGEVLASTVTAFNNAFATFNTAVAGPGANFSVWSRANAAVAPVVNSSTQVRPSTLRTRNDRV